MQQHPSLSLSRFLEPAVRVNAPSLSIRFAGRSIVIGPSFRSPAKRAFVLSHRWFTVARCDNNILPADNAILANKEEERGRSLNRSSVRSFVRPSAHPFPRSLSVRRGPTADRRFLIRQTQTDTWLKPPGYVFLGICNRTVSASLLVPSVVHSWTEKYYYPCPELAPLRFTFLPETLSRECWNSTSNFSISDNEVSRDRLSRFTRMRFDSVECTKDRFLREFLVDRRGKRELK